MIIPLTSMFSPNEHKLAGGREQFCRDIHDFRPMLNDRARVYWHLALGHRVFELQANVEVRLAEINIKQLMVKSMMTIIYVCMKARPVLGSFNGGRKIYISKIQRNTWAHLSMAGGQLGLKSRAPIA